MVNQTLYFADYQKAKEVCDKLDKLQKQEGVDTAQMFLDGLKVTPSPFVQLPAIAADAGIYSGEYLYYKDNDPSYAEEIGKEGIKSVGGDIVGEVISFGAGKVLESVAETLNPIGKHYTDEVIEAMTDTNKIVPDVLSDAIGDYVVETSGDGGDGAFSTGGGFGAGGGAGGFR